MPERNRSYSVQAGSATVFKVTSVHHCSAGRSTLQRFKSLPFAGFALMAVLGSPPAQALAPSASPSSIVVEPAQTQSKMQQGRALYEAGKFTEAAEVLRQAVQAYQKQGDRLQQAIGLSNLALVYQQLGQMSEAMQSIQQSLQLINAIRDQVQPKIIAQALENQGSIQLELGQTEQALATWQQADTLFARSKDPDGLVRSRISQAQALQIMGFYRRSLSLLTDLKPIVQSQPISATQAVAFQSLGDAFQVVGDFEQARQALQKSFAIARQLRSPQQMSATLSSLGNNARAQQRFSEAISFYQEAIATAPSLLAQTQAQVNLHSLLVSQGRVSEAKDLQARSLKNLNRLPASQPAIYARIQFAQSLMKANQPQGNPYRQEIAQNLVLAIQHAKQIGDKRAESYAIGNLGTLYEQAGQWVDAQQVTQQALALAQSLNASDIAYRWHWQLGRLLKDQGKIDRAIAAYDAAIKELQTLRGDLVAVNRDVQFSFRESVEPVYRESVALLLSSQVGQPSTQAIDKARQQIEALQLAELDNFFREACLDARTVLLDKVVDQDNPTAAIIYPIILPNELQVIVKLPKQPLRYHTIKRSRDEVEKLASQLRRNLVEPDATAQVKRLSQEMYGWLIEPIAVDLQKSGVNTLVFVPDGSLRSVPMAVLYDGQQYLVEKYAVSLSVGLQLLAPKALANETLQVLAAGLVEPPPPYSDELPPLPEIRSEFDLIVEAGVPAQKLIDEAFTSRALEKMVSTAPYNVVHLATHGQFSSEAKNTFILAADGPINVTELDSLLRNRGQTQTQAIELLVLSACQTAAGDDRATLGLAGVAVRAGARSTLASLWQISDRSTALFIGEFYKELRNTKVTKAEALRRAQVSLMKNYPNFSRPGYWAPYVLVGNWL